MGQRIFLLGKYLGIYENCIPNGIEIKLGNKYRVKLIVDYIGYISFGDRHNKACPIVLMRSNHQMYFLIYAILVFILCHQL